MQGPAKALGHSIHPALVTLPVGLLTTTVVCDLIHAVTHRPLFGVLAFWLLSFGIIGALVAAVPGLIDLVSIPQKTRAFRVGITHMAMMLGALAFFILSWWARLYGRIFDVHWGPIALALIGFFVLTVGAWLGGELVEQHGIGVRREAGLDAPSSLSVDRPQRRAPTPELPHPTEPRPV